MVSGLVARLVCWLAGGLIGWLALVGRLGWVVGARASCSSGLDSLGFPNGESGIVVVISITTLAALASSQVCLLAGGAQQRKARFRIQPEEGAPAAPPAQAAAAAESMYQHQHNGAWAIS